MGMAASQARYLALVARKSNCEYEGQQINQSRLNLANQTANLFNQMLGLSVPVPPSTQDFTRMQYSFTDGINGSVIDKWEQLATPDDQGNNYVVEYHYQANVYKGFQKKMNDPQVQFTYSVPSEQNVVTKQKERVDEIFDAQEAIREKQAIFDTANNEYQALLSKAKSTVMYADRNTYTNNKATTKDVTINGKKITQYVINKNEATPTEEARLTSFKDVTGYNTMLEVEDAIKAGTITDGSNAKKAYDAVKAWQSDGVEINESKIYFTTTTGGTDTNLTSDPAIVLLSDIDSMSGLHGNSTILPIYKIGKSTDTETDPYSIYGMQTKINELKATAETALAELQKAQKEFETINKPEYVGNSKLTSLGELTKEQLAEIKQIIRTMTENGVQSNFDRCFESSLNLAEDNYIGGIYSFERDGVTYYTTYYDLADATLDSEFMNDIDNQPKMNYYHANYVKENVYQKDKAVLDTDSVGRFKTVRFASDGAKYDLTVEQITDDAAYKDAMNKYAYESAEYDKMIQDINAKTSLIHQQDQQLELKLKQLDTEQNALSNEIDAVSKVVKDNVEKSFKTFGG